MTRLGLSGAAFLIFVSVRPVPAQSAKAVKRFEVASVKMAPAYSGAPRQSAARGGPGTNDPGRVTLENYSMINLLLTAFDVRFDQISGPDWLRVLGPSADLYNVSAVLPEGTSKADFHLMLRNLLVERFSLAMHIGKKESRTYRLVTGPGTPKLRKSIENESGAGDTSAGPTNAKATIGADGYPALPAGLLGASIGNRSRRRFVHETMADFAGYLSHELNGTVADGTGIEGKYDFELFWAAPSADDSDGVSIEQAVRDQLGLRLESTKGSEDVIVIDHIEKAPSGN